MANVSVSTVSRVVNGIETVNGKTRKRVLEALEKVNYYPNLQARSLVAGHTNTIGIIVSNLRNPFFVDVFRSIESDALKHGYEVLVGNTNYEADQLTANIRLMIGRRVTGMALVVSEEIPPIVSELSRAKIPTAIYDVGLAGKGIANIRFDNRRGMSQIVDYLWSLGHKRMAYIGISSSLLPANDRRSVFVERTRDCGIETKVVSVGLRDGFDGGRAAVREIVSSRFGPTAIICVNDITAIGALRELKALEIDVPGSISVTGFDNIEFSQFTSPSLTTIQVPREEIGHKMFSAILAGVDEKTELGNECTLYSELVVRESTGVAHTAASSHFRGKSAKRTS